MNKKKLLLRIFIPLILIVVIVSAVSIFLGKTPSKQQTPDASFVNHTLNVETQIQTDVLNQKVCPEYNGNYKYKSIQDVSFNREISSASERLTYEYISGYPDKNTFLYFMNKKKLAETQNEIITLVNGKYTKTKDSTKITEGIYYGNLNKSYVYIENKSGTIEIDETLYLIELEISQTAYWINKPIHSSGCELFVREKYVYDKHASNYLYITYVYEMI